MAYDKKKHLDFLRRPYKYTKGRKGSKKLSRLRSKLNTLNKGTRKTGDYIQSKYQFRLKASKVAKVPKVYYYGTDLQKIRNVIMTLDEFVLKPNHLSRGIGIRILKRDGNKFIDPNGDVLTAKDIVDECAMIIRLKRYFGMKAVLIEENITTHPKLNPNGFADIRMFYFKNRFLFCIARMGHKHSNTYGNTNRGASWGAVLNGKFVRDDRFIQSGNIQGSLAFFDQMALTGQKVTSTFGIIFQTIDMTVNTKGEVLVLESEQMPQIQYYLTNKGVDWLDKMTGTPLRIEGSRLKDRRGLSKYFPGKVRRSH